MIRQVGACTWIFGDMSLDQIIGRLASLGYSGIELTGDWNRYPHQLILKIIKDYNFKIFSLTPANVDLAHPEAKVRQEAIAYYLELLNYADKIGAPIVTCHGKVGRIQPLTSQEEEEEFFLEAVAKIAMTAQKLGIKLALEGLNRYESHLLNSAVQILALIEQIKSPALGLLLDTYHMNIEEPDLAMAIKTAGDKLFLVHLADSNRRAPGRGHIPFAQLFLALDEINYDGPLIIECSAPGPDPFTPIKGIGWEEAVWDEVAAAAAFLKKYSIL
ncbi:MAG: sugar phosphate isomerase/epimerase [Candidatus Aminicenantes bacterium]|nr:sugar phosphate isomerase/epimerase [Candidatus Aminicenantes bacterium]